MATEFITLRLFSLSWCSEMLATNRSTSSLLRSIKRCSLSMPPQSPAASQNVLEPFDFPKFDLFCGYQKKQIATSPVLKFQFSPFPSALCFSLSLNCPNSPDVSFTKDATLLGCFIHESIINCTKIGYCNGQLNYLLATRTRQVSVIPDSL